MRERVSEHEDRRIASFRIRQYSIGSVSSIDIERKWEEGSRGQIVASGTIIARLCADRKGLREGIYGEVREGKSEYYRRVSECRCRLLKSREYKAASEEVKLIDIVQSIKTEVLEILEELKLVHLLSLGKIEEALEELGASKLS